MTDYSEYTTQIEPMARVLYEQLSRREWKNAEDTAKLLNDIVFEVQRIAIKEQVRSGVGF